MGSYKGIKSGLKRKDTFQDADVYEHEKRASSDDLFFAERSRGEADVLCGGSGGIAGFIRRIMIPIFAYGFKFGLCHY